MKTQSLFILLLTIVCGGLLISGCQRNVKQTATGDCIYKDFKGTVTIKKIEPDPNPTLIDATYVFEAEDQNAPQPVKQIPGAISLPKEVIDMKDIKPGKKFQTSASYVEKGTCSAGPELANFYTWE